MLKSLNNLLLCGALFLIPALGMAQQPADTMTSPEGEQVKLEEEAFSPIPQGLRIGADVSRFLGNFVNTTGRFYEVNTDFDFDRYLLSVDWGTGRQTRDNDSLQYRTSGNYFRIGPDVNFLSGNDDQNALFLGFRYARSWYEEKLNTNFQVPGWGTMTIDPERTTSARWLEGVFGLKARIWDNFYLGYTLRYKFALKIKDDERFTSYEVPGFGKVGDGNAFAFNYHIFYRIPFK